jgi:hypothetical protein
MRRLEQAVRNLVEQIKQYESDTFSASQSGVTDFMAERMAAILIEDHLFNEDGAPGSAIDGAVIGYAFDAVDEWMEAEAAEKSDTP